jgi:N-acetylmuramoyl-L-alanine amidase
LSNEDTRTQMALGIANGITKFQPLSGFKDISGHWAFESIHRLNEKGIVFGSNDKYSPERPLTRAEFLTIMDRVFEFSIEKAGGESTVQEEEPAGDDMPLEGDAAVEGLEIVEEEVPLEDADSIEGDVPAEGETSVEGNQSTMEDPVMEDSMIDIKKSVPKSDFSDMDLTHWAYTILEKAYSQGYIQGYPDGSVRPDQAITRAEVSVLFDRIWNEDSKKNEFPIGILLFDDVPDYSWYASSVYRLKGASIIRGISETTFIPDRYMNRAEIAAMIDRYMVQFDSNS